MTSRSPQRRAGALLAALAVVAATLLGSAGTASAAHHPSVRHASAAEAVFVSRLNAARVAAGLPRLSVRRDLVAVARAQAGRMARHSLLYHNPHLTTDVTHWSRVGENVGYGPDAASVHTAFMNSAPHRANILGAAYTQVGIGTVIRNGRVWVAEVFRRPLH